MGRWGKPCNLGKRAQQASVALVVALTVLMSVALVAVGCGSDGGSPEAAVQQFLTALEKQDIDTILDLTTSPEDIAALEAMGMSKEDLKSDAEAEMLGLFGELKFSDVTMETEQQGEGAVVTITGGTMSVEGLSLDLTDVAAVGFQTEFYLYQVDGKWYIDLEG